MNLEDLVPDRELCEKWKSIGGRQDTQFVWVEIGKDFWNIFLRTNIHMGNFTSPPEVEIAAPLVSELIPIFQDQTGYWIVMDTCIKHIELFNSYGYLKKTINNYDFIGLPNALMQMALEVEGK